jgi:hypothetical protein
MLTFQFVNYATTHNFATPNNLCLQYLKAGSLTITKGSTSVSRMQLLLHESEGGGKIHR